MHILENDKNEKKTENQFLICSCIYCLFIVGATCTGYLDRSKDIWFHLAFSPVLTVLGMPIILIMLIICKIPQTCKNIWFWCRKKSNWTRHQIEEKLTNFFWVFLLFGMVTLTFGTCSLNIDEPVQPVQSGALALPVFSACCLGFVKLIFRKW